LTLKAKIDRSAKDLFIYNEIIHEHTGEYKEKLKKNKWTKNWTTIHTTLQE